MKKFTLRKMKITELETVFKHIEKDFAVGEYPPYDILLNHLRSGAQEGVILTNDGQDVAYSICYGNTKNGYVLISLLAVYEEYRGNGFGTALLNKLIENYSDIKGLIIEVEKPEESSSEEEYTTCKKRVWFYQRAGFYLIPDINYFIWDIPLHLMALPLGSTQLEISSSIGQIMYDIYLDLMGKRLIHKMKLYKQEPGAKL